jgi:hypothetical protein
MIAADPPDERVIYCKRFQGEQFDFRAKAFSLAMIVANS